MSIIAASIVVGCDEGRIYDNYITESHDGLTARLTAVVEGADMWPDGYTLSIAGFSDNNEYAVISKNISPDAESRCDIILEGIPAETDIIALCVIDRLRRRVTTFAETECTQWPDTIRLDVRSIDVSPSAAIQSEIFNTTCINCHGGANFAAAGLNLTAGKSFGELVGITSLKMPDMARVAPGNSNESLLWRILSSDESASWRYDHSVEVVVQQKLELIKNWIDNGAKH